MKQADELRKSIRVATIALRKLIQKSDALVDSIPKLSRPELVKMVQYFDPKKSESVVNDMRGMMTEVSFVQAALNDVLDKASKRYDQLRMN